MSQFRGYVVKREFIDNYCSSISVVVDGSKKTAPVLCHFFATWIRPPPRHPCCFFEEKGAELPEIGDFDLMILFLGKKQRICLLTIVKCECIFLISETLCIAIFFAQKK